MCVSVCLCIPAALAYTSMEVLRALIDQKAFVSPGELQFDKFRGLEEYLKKMKLREELNKTSSDEEGEEETGRPEGGSDDEYEYEYEYEYESEEMGELVADDEPRGVGDGGWEIDDADAKMDPMGDDREARGPAAAAASQKTGKFSARDEL